MNYNNTIFKIFINIKYVHVNSSRHKIYFIEELLFAYDYYMKYVCNLKNNSIKHVRFYLIIYTIVIEFNFSRTYVKRVLNVDELKTYKVYLFIIKPYEVVMKAVFYYSQTFFIFIIQRLFYSYCLVFSFSIIY